MLLGWLCVDVERPVGERENLIAAEVTMCAVFFHDDGPQIVGQSAFLGADRRPPVTNRSPHRILSLQFQHHKEVAAVLAFDAVTRRAQ
jgi:hypothetical protein